MKMPDMLKYSDLIRENVPEDFLGQYDMMIESENMVEALWDKYFNGELEAQDYDNFVKGMQCLDIGRSGFIIGMKHVHGIIINLQSSCQTVRDENA